MTSSSPTTPVPLNERALLLTLSAIQFTHIVDFMVMMPLGPQFTRLFGISDASFGLLVSAYTLAAGASGLIASTFIDRFERKTLLLWLYAGFALATLACALAPSYVALMTARILAGLFGGVMGALVQTIVGDVIPFERRGQAMGMVMASFSLATVAGVPASLWLAETLGWHATFLAIALASLCVGGFGLRTLPRLDAHLVAQRARTAGGSGTLAMLAGVLREPNHWRAFGLSALMMGTSFAVIPYLTIYMTTNIGISSAQLPLVYLAGGVATLFSSRLIGLLADRWGKVFTFRLVATVALVPLLTITNLGVAPLWLLLVTTTCFFVFVSGRMIPGMALITAAVEPSKRGTFMSLNSSVQSAAMGVAAIVGGLLIGRDAQGLVTGYQHCGWVAAALTLLALWWVGRLRLSPLGLQSQAPGVVSPGAAAPTTSAPTAPAAARAPSP